MIKKTSFRYSLLLLAQFVFSVCRANDDDFSLDDIDLDDVIGYEITNTSVRSADVDTLANALRRVIKNPLWQNTMTPKGRDILYHLPYKIATVEHGGLATSLFFNMTDKMHVSADSLIDLANGLDPQFLQLFIGASPNISPELAQEIVSLIPLFQKFSIQERKAGALIQGGFIKGPYTIQLHTSAFMAERNFWISPSDRAVITELSDRIFPGQETHEEEFYIIKYGMGDTRLKAGINTLNLTNLQTDIGIEAIFPTSRFSSQQLEATPQIDLTPGLLDNIDELQTTGINLLKSLRNHLVNPQLGNGGHFGIGLYFESKIGIFHNLAQLYTRLSYDSLFEAEAIRMIMFKKTLNPDDLDPSTVPAGDPAHDAAVLNKVGQFFKEYMFPTGFKVTTKPGGIFNFVTGVNIEVKKWRYALGYDFYAQKKETIAAIHNSNYGFNDLRIEDAESVASQQHKIFSESMYVFKYPKSELGIGWGGDTTVYSKGLGYDWTVYAKIAASF